jgi:hypothetical protein
MQHAFELADFRKNRSFLSWLLPSARLDASAIEPLYREPIELIEARPGTHSAHFVPTG